jgi:hypothetical protein
MEARDDERVGLEKGDLPAGPTPIWGREHRSVHAIAIGVATLIVLLISIWRCG